MAIGENYVSLWFGQRKDVAKSPKLCDNEVRVADSSMVINSGPGKTYFYVI